MSTLTSLLLAIVVVSCFACCDSAPRVLTMSKSKCQLKGGTLYCEHLSSDELFFHYSEEYKDVTHLGLSGDFRSFHLVGGWKKLLSLTVNAELDQLSAAELPESLESLDVSYNKLVSLGDLGKYPAGLRLFDASYNMITSIDFGNLQEGVEMLNIENNNIETLPLWPLLDRKSTVELKMLNNPIVCTCSTVDWFANVAAEGIVTCDDESLVCFKCKTGLGFDNYPMVDADPHVSTNVLVAHDNLHNKCIKKSLEEFHEKSSVGKKIAEEEGEGF